MARSEEIDERPIRLLAGRLISRRDLDLAAAQAGRDLELLQRDARLRRIPERVRDLGLRYPEQAHDPTHIGPGPGDRGGKCLGRPRHLPHLMELARRPGQDDDRRAGSGSRRHYQSRRGAHRVEHGRTKRDDRLLAVRLADGVEVQARPAAHQRTQDLGDLRLELVVEHHLAAGELADDLSGQIVGGGTEAAACDDQRHPLSIHVPERRHEIARPVADDLDHRGVHADLEQALGQPRPVAVGDDPGQDLGAGDQDPGSRTAAPVPETGPPRRNRTAARRPAHAQVGSWPAGNGVVFPGVSS